jgi:hypothetical protein
MEKFTHILRPSIYNKEYSFPSTEQALSCFLVFSADQFNPTLTSTGTLTGTSRYSLLPAGNRCPGNPTNIDVQLHPVSYKVANPPTQTICSGSQNTAIILTSIIPGAFCCSSTVINNDSVTTGCSGYGKIAGKNTGTVTLSAYYA